MLAVVCLPYEHNADVITAPQKLFDLLPTIIIPQSVFILNIIRPIHHFSVALLAVL